jgi:hypothetical protein
VIDFEISVVVHGIRVVVVAFTTHAVTDNCADKKKFNLGLFMSATSLK